MKLKKVAGSGMDKAYVGPSLSPTFHPAPPPGFVLFSFLFHFVARFFQSARNLIFFSFA